MKIHKLRTNTLCDNHKAEFVLSQTTSSIFGTVSGLSRLAIYQCYNIHCSQRNRLNRQLTSIYVCNCIAANFFLFHFILYYYYVSTVLLAQCLIGLYYTLLCSMFLSDACLGAHVISYDRYILITMAIHIVTASRCNVIQV